MCYIRRYRTVVSHCVQSDLPPPSMLNRCIYYALLRAVNVQINVKLSLRCAQCMFKLDSQLYLRVCTLTTMAPTLRAYVHAAVLLQQLWTSGLSRGLLALRPTRTLYLISTSNSN